MIAPVPEPPPAQAWSIGDAGALPRGFLHQEGESELAGPEALADLTEEMGRQALAGGADDGQEDDIAAGQDEVARALGITEQTARARVSRALRALSDLTTSLERSPEHA